MNPGAIGFNFVAVPSDSTFAHNISVAEEEVAFCWEKGSFGAAMTVTNIMGLDSVEPLRLESEEEFTAGGATVSVSARLKGGFCSSSCCC